MPTRILLQTTLLSTETDDWTIRHFSMLRDYLEGLTNAAGAALFTVTARDREPNAAGDDPVLSALSRDTFDELWLFALDVGGGLTAPDCAGITRFHQQGGGILTTRDHQDMGISMCPLEKLGGFHYFHSRQVNPDPEHCCRDDIHTPTIDWPNYHSGANGDYQTITAIAPIHPLLKTDTGILQRLPAHPHEGGVGVPAGADYAQVIAIGQSKITGRPFNLIVAAERNADAAGNLLGRMVAQSTFHHFVDYNLDPDRGCPSFVSEPPGNAVKTDPQGLEDTYTYFKNLATWLAPETHP